MRNLCREQQQQKKNPHWNKGLSTKQNDSAGKYG